LSLFRRNIVERLGELEPTLVEKLRAQKVPVEELIIPDEIHHLLRWSDWVGAYRALQDFRNFCR
jgi:hypothetical protein